MKWDSKILRALFVAATIGAMIMTAVANTGWG